MSATRKTRNQTAKNVDRRRKSAPDIASVALARPPAQGGARLPLGAHAGNTGGKPGRSGRPPSAVRETARQLFDDRLQTLAKIADNRRTKASDRIAAIDRLGRYGMTESIHVVTVGSPELQQRLERQVALIVERLDAESVAIVRAIMGDVWR